MMVHIYTSFMPVSPYVYQSELSLMHVNYNKNITKANPFIKLNMV